MIESGIFSAVTHLIMAPCGEGNKNEVFPFGQRSQAAGGFASVHAGHADIDERQMRLELGNHGERRNTVIGNPHIRAQAPQQRRATIRNVLIIIDFLDAKRIKRGSQHERNPPRGHCPLHCGKNNT